PHDRFDAAIRKGSRRIANGRSCARRCRRAVAHGRPLWVADADVSVRDGPCFRAVDSRTTNDPSRRRDWAIHIPSNQRYSVGSAQSALVPLRQFRQRGEVVYLFRAASTGNDAFVLTPVGIPNGECISCVTVHYFVTVV